MSCLTVGRIPAIEYPLVTRFYNQARYKSKPAKVDEVWGLRSQGTLIAAVRLCPLILETSGNDDLSTAVWFLRSLAVLPEKRRTGLGDHLMAAVCERLEKASWCFPYTHLQDFYARHGFQVVALADAPTVLRARFLVYERQGKSLLIMRRPSFF